MAGKKRMTAEEKARREEIHAEVEAMRLAILGYQDVPRKRAKPKPRTGGSRRGANLASRPPTYNRQEILRLFREGKRVGEIAEITGAHRATVHRALQEVDPTPASARPTGRQRQKLCAKGLHDMDLHSREIPKAKGGGRMCLECKRVRQAQEWRRKKARLAAEREAAHLTTDRELAA